MKSKDIQHWAVTCNVNHKQVLVIESNCVCGKDLSDQDKESIRNMAEHLLAFVGRGNEHDETAKEMIKALATAVAASTSTIVRINNQVTALRSELQDARNAIEEIKQRLDENDRIERECR